MTNAGIIALTIKWSIILLIVLSVCSLILLVLLFRRYAKEQDQEHAERLASIMATKDLGQTAWAQTDAHKSAIIREQAKRIKRLEDWKKHTEENMRRIGREEVLADDV